MRIPALLLASLMASTVLSACAARDEPAASAPTPTAEPSRGLPEGSRVPSGSAAGIVVKDDGRIVVVTFGSSSNPAVVRKASADGQTVTVDVSAVPDRPATMDFVPTASSLVLPEGVDTTTSLTVVLGRFGTVRLPDAQPGRQAWVEPAD